jgi:hypothetical protein
MGVLLLFASRLLGRVGPHATCQDCDANTLHAEDSIVPIGGRPPSALASFHEPAKMRKGIKMRATLILLLASPIDALTASLIRRAGARHAPVAMAAAAGDPQFNPNLFRHRLERSFAITERRERIATVEQVAAVASMWTERQRTRFSYMILNHEPLPQEIVGLQALFGAMGATVYGVIGLFLGVFQLGPCLSMAPGRTGNWLRYSGWQSFTVLRAGALKCRGLWNCVLRWDAAVGASDKARTALTAVTAALTAPPRRTDASGRFAGAGGGGGGGTSLAA